LIGIILNKIVKKKLIILILIIFISVFISALTWEYIKLPYDVNNQLYGEYANNKYNPLNDTIRYIFFISIPLLSFLISYIILYKERLFNIDEAIKGKIISYSEEKNNTLNLFFYLLCVFLIINFVTLDYYRYNYNLDFFHEGTYLAPFINLKFTNNLWLSSYLDYGLLGNFFPVIFWKLFNLETIGAARFFQLLLLLTNKILLIYLCKIISENLNLDKKIEIIYFVLIAILSVSLVDLDVRNTKIPSKFFIVLIFLIIFFQSIKSYKKPYIYNFLTGLISSVSIFCYLDIGIFLSVFLIFVLFYFFYRLDYNKIFSILIGFISGLIFIYILLPTTEIVAFYENTKMFIFSIDYLDGLIYPTPFFSKDARATRALMLIIITGILVIIFNLDKTLKPKKEIKVFLAFIFILNVLFFKSAMMRSDSAHIKTSSSFLVFLFAAIVLYFATIFLINLLNDNKFFKKNLTLIKKNYLIIPLLIILTNFVVISINSIWTHQNTRDSIFSFSDIKKFLEHDDNFYLSDDYLEMINYYKNLTREDKCVQIFTNEAAVPYLLKKPTCTKFYLMFISPTIENQKLFIKQLKNTKPKFILFHSEIDPYQDTHVSMPMVLDYINSKYSMYEKFKYWTFVKIN